MSPRARSGAVLVVVLLVSAATWLLLAGVLLITRLQFGVAVATRDHAVARAQAEWLLEARRDAQTWPVTAPDEEEGEEGGCAWRVTLLAHDDATAWYQAFVRYGRAQVTLDATVHRRPRPIDDASLLAHPPR